VVEAGINSGALINASQAADQGRNLYEGLCDRNPGMHVYPPKTKQNTYFVAGAAGGGLTVIFLPSASEYWAKFFTFVQIERALRQIVKIIIEPLVNIKLARRPSK
jgi:hypothetical protein